MSIIEYTGPSTPQEIRRYLMRRTKDQIVWEYLRLWREYGELESERDALAAHVERLHAFRSAVCGWRESDWPEGFCRRTAELVADYGRQAEEDSQ